MYNMSNHIIRLQDSLALHAQELHFAFLDQMSVDFEAPEVLSAEPAEVLPAELEVEHYPALLVQVLKLYTYPHFAFGY